MDDQTQNPFRPGLGKCPPLRVGHKWESRELRETLEDILDGDVGSVYMMPGPPGAGKTSLLAEHARMALDGGALVRVVSGKDTGDHPGFVRRVFDGDKDVGGEISRGGPAVREPGGHGASRLESVLAAMVEAAPTFLVIVDTQLLDTQAAMALLCDAQTLMGDKAPFALVFAGSAGMETVFRDTGLSFWSRTRRLRLPALEEGEVAEALSVPAESSGRGFDDDALALAVRESQGYPLFVQMLGAAAWQSAAESGADRISLAAAQDGVAKARADMEAFLAGLRDTLAKAGVLREAEAVSRALVDAGEACEIDRRRFAGILKAEGVSDGRSRLRVQKRMEEVGLIRLADGHAFWKPAVPGLFRHVAEHAGE